MARRPARKESWSQKEWGDYVLERSGELWDAERDYREAAEKWEKAWKLEAFTKETIQQGESVGKEYVTPNDPYNIVKLVERLLGGQVRYDVIAPDDQPGTVQEAEARELWIPGFFYRQQMETGRNLRRRLTWWAAVRGRIAVDVRWVKEVLPEYYKDKRLPIMARDLDPQNVLMQESEFGWPQYGIHRYTTPAYKIRERWGTPANKALPEEQFDDDHNVEVHDYWDAEWNTIVVNGVCMKKPVKHEYKRIPLIMAYADPTPLNDPLYKGLSILHPMLGLWQRKSKIWSLIATGLLWHFWPLITAEQTIPGGEEPPPNMELTPGKYQALPHGVTLKQLTISPNVPLAEILQGAVSGAIQDATFPKTLYGQEPSVELAGFALSNLSSSARGRIGPIREPLEWALSETVQLILDLVKDRGKGNVEVFAERKDEEGYSLYNLKDANLSKHMPIKTTIVPDVPQDEQQLAVLGLQMVKEKVVSMQTYRELFAPKIQHAKREETRVLYEMALMDEGLMKQQIAEAYQQTTGKQMPQPPPPEGMPPGMQGGPPPQGPPPGGEIPPPDVLMAMAQGQIPLPPGVTMEMVQMALQQAMQQGGPGPGPQGLPPGIGVPPQAMAPGPMQPPPGVPPQLFAGGGNMPPIQVPPVG